MSRVQIVNSTDFDGSVAGRIIPTDDPTKPTIVLGKVEPYNSGNYKLILITGQFINNGEITEMSRCNFNKRFTDHHNIKGPEHLVEYLETLEGELF